MVTQALPYRPHDHQACVNQALNDARSICQAHNARLTPIRQRVLELVWQSHKPLGAYDLLAQLTTEGQNAAPPTVYRALDFLQQHGLVHRIASLNAFIGCSHPGQRHTGMFLICQQCRNVLEISAPAVTEAIQAASAGENFRAEELTLEVSGLCPQCQAESSDG